MVKLYKSITPCLLTPKLIAIAKHKALLFQRKLREDANTEDIVGILTGFDMIQTEKECGGYCDYTNRIIAYNSGGLATVFHEIAHAFQAEVEIFDKAPQLLSNFIHIEQQCETLAYLFYNTVFPNRYLSPTFFNSYFSLDDVKFLSEWYEGSTIVNDIQLNPFLILR